MKFELRELIVKLKEEHREGVVYRGQTQEWPSPLVPSLLRPLFVPESPDIVCEDRRRLRKSGTHFVEEQAILQAVLNMPPSEMQVYGRRVSVMKFMQNALGYPMCQIFAQQAGLKSEGLDVTADLDTAVFFATHHLREGRYIPMTTGTGIIYRFQVGDPMLDLDAIRASDFYSCPTYLPSYKILALLGRCGSSDDSIQSLKEYRAAINWGPLFDLKSVRQSRPFELIQIPEDSLNFSRIINQKAGLLIPDYILNRYWLSETYAPPSQEIGSAGEPCVEDLSHHADVSKFLFSHVPGNLHHVQHDPKHYFPREDVVCSIARGWFLSMLKNPFGSIPLPTDINALLLWQEAFADGLARDPGDKLVF